MKLLENDKTSVICDTSIWYKLAEKPDYMESLNGFTLVSSYNSFFELITSSNLSRKEKSAPTIMALDFMCKNSIFIDANPYEFLINENYRQNQWINDAFNSFKTLNIRENLHDANFNVEPIKSWISDRKEATKLDANLFNEFISKIKSNSLMNPGKRKIHKISVQFENIVKAFIENQIKIFYGSENIKPVRWEEHKYFMTMLTNYIILLVNSEQKQRANDIGDLYNMVYVKANEKYLTADKKTWLKVSDMDKLTQEKFIYFDKLRKD